MDGANDFGWTDGGSMVPAEKSIGDACARLFVDEGAANAPVEVGHRTVTICHLANIVRELNHSLRWDPVLEQFSDDAAANKSLARPRQTCFSLSGFQVKRDQLTGSLTPNREDD